MTKTLFNGVVPLTYNVKSLIMCLCVNLKVLSNYYIRKKNTRKDSPTKCNLKVYNVYLFIYLFIVFPA